MAKGPHPAERLHLPQFLKTIAAAGGAHHSVLSQDERYLFVQNSFLNLNGMSDGPITVIDLQADTVFGSIDPP